MATTTIMTAIVTTTITIERRDWKAPRYIRCPGAIGNIARAPHQHTIGGLTRQLYSRSLIL